MAAPRAQCSWGPEPPRPALPHCEDEFNCENAQGGGGGGRARQPLLSSWSPPASRLPGRTGGVGGGGRGAWCSRGAGSGTVLELSEAPDKQKEKGSACLKIQRRLRAPGEPSLPARPEPRSPEAIAERPEGAPREPALPWVLLGAQLASPGGGRRGSWGSACCRPRPAVVPSLFSAPSSFTAGAEQGQAAMPARPVSSPAGLVPGSLPRAGSAAPSLRTHLPPASARLQGQRCLHALQRLPWASGVARGRSCRAQSAFSPRCFPSPSRFRSRPAASACRSFKVASFT